MLQVMEMRDGVLNVMWCRLVRLCSTAVMTAPEPVEASVEPRAWCRRGWRRSSKAWLCPTVLRGVCLPMFAVLAKPWRRILGMRFGDS